MHDQFPPAQARTQRTPNNMTVIPAQAGTQRGIRSDGICIGPPQAFLPLLDSRLRGNDGRHRERGSTLGDLEWKWRSTVASGAAVRSAVRPGPSEACCVSYN